MPTALLLAETDVLFGAGVANALQDQQDFELRQPAFRNQESLQEALTVDKHAIALVGEALVQDLAQLAQTARENDSKVVLLTTRQHTHAFTELPSIRGALPYNTDARQLLACLRSVVAGERWCVASPTSGRLTPGARVLANLSPRQLRVIADVSRGAKNLEIAQRLGTSEQAIKNMLSSIYDVTGVSDRLELALFVLHHPELATAAKTAAETSSNSDESLPSPTNMRTG